MRWIIIQNLLGAVYLHPVPSCCSPKLILNIKNVTKITFDHFEVIFGYGKNYEIFSPFALEI